MQTSVCCPPCCLRTRYRLDAANELIEEVNIQPYSGTFAAWATLATLSHNRNGNRAREDRGERNDFGWTNYSTTYSWDPVNRLLAIVDSNPGSGIVNQTNSYRPDGLRHRKTEGATIRQIVWDQRDVLAQVDETGALVQFYSGGANLLKARVTGAFYPDQYAHLDRQGTVVMWSETTGAPITSVLDPDPWGAEASSWSPYEWLGQPGYWYEHTLRRALYYVRARWYVAGGPGWLSPDPLSSLQVIDRAMFDIAGGRPAPPREVIELQLIDRTTFGQEYQRREVRDRDSRNRYRYVADRPLTHVDPSGRFSIVDLLLVPSVRTSLEPIVFPAAAQPSTGPECALYPVHGNAIDCHACCNDYLLNKVLGDLKKGCQKALKDCLRGCLTQSGDRASCVIACVSKYVDPRKGPGLLLRVRAFVICCYTACDGNPGTPEKGGFEPPGRCKRFL